MPPPGSPGSPGKRDTPAASPEARHLCHGIDGQRDKDADDEAARHVVRVDRLIAEVAERQQNLISIEQLRTLDVGRGEREWRLRHGRLHAQHRGVYSVGSSLLPPLGRERAALLAVPDTVLTLGSAAGVYGLMPLHRSGDVHLLSTINRRDRDGIKVHRTNHLPATDVRTYRGLALTSPVRLVLDMTSNLGAGGLERLIAEVIAREPDAAEALRRRGSKRLRELVEGGPRRTRSSIERALLKLVKDAGLPRPLTNTMLHGEEIDAYWPQQRLVVEVDTYATHGDRVAFERDRRKDAALVARGLAVVRITDRELGERPARVVSTLAMALARAA